MKDLSLQFASFIKKASADDRLTRTQLSLYIAILNCWYDQKGTEEIKVTRKNLMSLSKIPAISTYHRNLKTLITLGYIFYAPTFNHYVKSKVLLV
jgi:hypothetical protein